MPPAKRSTRGLPGDENRQGKHGWAGVCAGELPPGQTTVTAAQLQPVAEAISAIHGLYADIEQDEAGRAIWRIRVRVNASELGLNAQDVEAQLRGGEIAIYARKYQLHQGFLASIHAR